MRKLAIKKLTASDLTFFEWHFRNNPAGNQKAINLNRDVFIDDLYSSLPGIAAGQGGRIPLSLSIYGPGTEGEYNLQRKIIKLGAYKNWRLNGEFIYNPQENPTRFNVLQPDDFAILDFDGEVIPTSLRVFLIARGKPEDGSLHSSLNGFIGIEKMKAISTEQLQDIISSASPAPEHPIQELFLDEALEDAAQGGLKGLRKLYTRRSGRRLTRDELKSARDAAGDIGQSGEEMVDAYLADLLAKGEIAEYEWVAQENAAAPFDFLIKESATQKAKADAKATTGEFDRTIHISTSELIEMAESEERYDLYRVYLINERQAKLRIAGDMRSVARTIIEILRTLPEGISADGVSVSPRNLPFGPEKSILLPEE